MLFILSVTFKLNKVHQLKMNYGSIGEQLELMRITHPQFQDVARAVMEIRKSKLPDPKVIGNAGSFFKNPTITNDDYFKLKNDYPNIPGFQAAGGFFKIPAAWLIEYLGWKGFRKGDAGVHGMQALVLVNYGRASGDEIWDLSEEIFHSVKKKFGISLEREVQMW